MNCIAVIGAFNEEEIKVTDQSAISLLGIDPRIAYAKRKYHFGWIWAGVTRGFKNLISEKSFCKILIVGINEKMLPFLWSLERLSLFFVYIR